MSESATAASRRIPRGLIVLTPGTLEASRTGGGSAMLASMERAASAAIEGGVRSIMVREPALEDGLLLELAQRLRERLDAASPGGAWLGIHDRLHLAHAARADAVHLGGTSLPLAAARSVIGAKLPIGLSSHDGDEAHAADADFYLHAPAFPPTSKALHGRDVLGWDGMERFAQGTERPVFALGGVTAERLRERSEGSTQLAGVALIGSLWGTDQTPIVGSGSPLMDVARISKSAAELCELCAVQFGPVGEAAP